MKKIDSKEEACKLLQDIKIFINNLDSEYKYDCNELKLKMSIIDALQLYIDPNYRYE